ncbi:hypothetical protein, partial [Weissella muntiaci]|uniref:hypothetical protein n=1 Tax=Weissella muntiaci TaxID=2508881 RepID=UPI001651F284
TVTTPTGTTTTLTGTSYTPTTPGTYTVTTTMPYTNLDGSTGTVTAKQIITVIIEPTVSVPANQIVTVGSSVDITSVVTPGTDNITLGKLETIVILPDGSEMIIAGNSFVPKSQGSYTVMTRLAYTNPDGSIGTAMGIQIIEVKSANALAEVRATATSQREGLQSQTSLPMTGMGTNDGLLALGVITTLFGLLVIDQYFDKSNQ